MTQTLPKVVADFQTQLAAAVSAGATTCTLSSVTDADGDALADGLYSFTIDGASRSLKEYVVGQLAASTRTLTDVRSVDRQGNLSSGFARAHRVGATAVITDHAALGVAANMLRGSEGLDASAPLFYDGPANIASANQLATKAYADSVGSGTSSLYYDRQTVSGVAGETLAVRDLCYFRESDQRWWKADDDVLATVAQVQLGLAATVAAPGAACQIVTSGKVSGFTGLTLGAKYYASATPGAIATAAGANAAFVGWADTATTLLFNTGPGLYDPSKAEKDALAGTFGAPSATNDYVTSEGLTDLGPDQSQLTANATVAFGEANATTRRNRVAQSFVAGTGAHFYRGLRVRKAASTGTFTGTVTVSLQADSAGAPSGSALASRVFTNLQWAAVTNSSDATALFASELAVTPGTTYWIVAESSTADNANCPNLATNSAGGYGSGILRTWNTADGWTTVTGVDLYFEVLEGLGGRGLRDAAHNTGTLRGAISTERVRCFDESAWVNPTGSTFAMYHGLGKVPHTLEFRWAEGSSTSLSRSSTVVDVIGQTYATDWQSYNEATSGGAILQGGAFVYSTTEFILEGGGNSYSKGFQLVSVDENIVVINRTGGSGAPGSLLIVRA